jgi:MFS family permease
MTPITAPRLSSSRTTPVAPASGGPAALAALGLLCLAQFMVILDVTVVNVALPSIGADLHLDRSSLPWVVTAYRLCFGGLMLLGGRLPDTLGRRLFLAGLGLFTAAPRADRDRCYPACMAKQASGRNRATQADSAISLAAISGPQPGRRSSDGPAGRPAGGVAGPADRSGR